MHDDIIVVGAGIGGLVLARALTETGLRVRVLERATAPSPAGAGITLAENAVACLRALGLFSALEPRGRWIREFAITDAGGRSLAEGRAPATEPGMVFAVHRRDLHELLLGAAEEVPLDFGTTVERVTSGPEGVELELSSGARAATQLLVGADGIGSGVRRLIFGAARRRYAGYTCWRAVVPAPQLDRGVEMWGRGQRVGLVPLAGGMAYVFLVENAPAGTPEVPLLAEALAERFSGFGAEAPAVLARLGEAQAILHHDIEDLPEHELGRGRVALVGDAAHALTPNLGQGAAMAIEDALVLARAVGAAGPTADAVEAYRAERAARVRAVARRSWRMGQVAQWSSPVATWARDALLRLTPDSASTASARAWALAGPAAPAPS